MPNGPELPPIEREPAPPPSMRAVILASLGAAVVALMLFSWIAGQVDSGRTQYFDQSVRTWVHGFASPPLTTTMKVISAVGSEGLAIVFIVAVVAFFRMRWRRAAFWMLLTMAGGLILEIALKRGFHRARPVPFFGVAPHSYSFPSGHSLMSFCIFGVLAGLITARIRSVPLRVLTWVVAAALVGAIGLSRIYLGVHYPSDVVAGYLAAALWVSALITVDRVRRHKRLRARN